MGFNPIGGHTSGTDISGATVLTPPAGFADGALTIMMQAISQNLRYTLDGTTPTGTVGFQLLAGDTPIFLTMDANTTITVIEEAASAEIQYQFGA